MADQQPQQSLPTIESDEEAASVARLIQGGQINGAARDNAMAALRAYASKPAAPAASASAEEAPQTGVEHLKDVAGTFIHHPLTAGVGMAENALQGVTGAVGRTYQRLVGEEPTATGYEPRTEAGQELAREGATEGQAVSRAYDATAGTGPIASEIKRGAGVAADALATTGLLPEVPKAVAGTARVAGRTLDTGMNAAVSTADRAALPTGVNEAAANGYKVLPSGVARANPSAAVEGNVAGTSREAIDPGARLRVQQFNSARATADVAKDIPGVDPANIKPEDLEAAKAQPNSIYDELGRQAGSHPMSSDMQTELAGVGTGRATTADARVAIQQNVEHFRSQFEGGVNGPEAVQTVRDLRRSSSQQMASNDVNQQAEGWANRQIANIIERELMRNVPPDSPITREFPQARQTLAKIHDAEAATAKGSGQVDPQVYARLDNGQLTGGAANVAQAAKAMPGEMVHPSQWAGGSSPVPSTHVGVIRKVIGAAHHLPGMDVTSEGFQTAHYGAEQAPTEPVPPAELTRPPGSVGSPPVQPSLPLPEPRPAAPAYELAPPPGGAHEPLQRPLSGPFEPNRNPMDRATYDRAVLENMRRQRRHVGEPQ